MRDLLIYMGWINYRGKAIWREIIIDIVGSSAIVGLIVALGWVAFYGGV